MRQGLPSSKQFEIFSKHFLHLQYQKLWNTSLEVHDEKLTIDFLFQGVWAWYIISVQDQMSASSKYKNKTMQVMVAC